MYISGPRHWNLSKPLHGHLGPPRLHQAPEEPRSLGWLLAPILDSGHIARPRVTETPKTPQTRRALGTRGVPRLGVLLGCSWGVLGAFLGPWESPWDAWNTHVAMAAADPTPLIRLGAKPLSSSVCPSVRPTHRAQTEPWPCPDRSQDSDATQRNRQASQKKEREVNN